MDHKSRKVALRVKGHGLGTFKNLQSRFFLEFFGLGRRYFHFIDLQGVLDPDDFRFLRGNEAH